MRIVVATATAGNLRGEVRRVDERGQAGGSLADAGLGRVRRSPHVSGGDLPQPMERPERVHGRDGRRLRGKHRPDRGLGVCKPALDEQPLRRRASPAVRIAEEGGRLGCSGGSHPPPGREAIPLNPPDAARLITGPEVERFGEAGWHVLRMLDRAAAHVDHPERSVGSGGREHRAEPRVAGCQEFRAVGAHGIAREAGSQGPHPATRDEMRHGLADEGIANGIGAEQVAAKDRQSAGRGVRAGMGGRRRVGLGDREDTTRGAAGRNVLVAAAQVDERVAGDRIGRQTNRDHGIAIARGEATPQVVERVAKLAETGGGRDASSGKVDLHVAAVDLHALGCGPARPVHHSARQATGDRDGVVDVELRTRGPELRIARLESRGDDVAAIGSAIAIGIDEHQHIGGGRDQQASPSGQHALRERHVVGHDRRSLVEAVTIDIIEPHDPRHRRRSRRRTFWIISVFDDVGSGILVERDRHGIHHGGLGRREPHGIARRQDRDRLHLLRCRWHRGRVFLRRGDTRAEHGGRRRQAASKPQQHSGDHHVYHGVHISPGRQPESQKSSPQPGSLGHGPCGDQQSGAVTSRGFLEV